VNDVLAKYHKVDRFTIAYADVDMMRHANNLAYLRWAEQSRTEYFADVLGEAIAGARGMILAKITIDYTLPLVYRERVAIGTRVGRIGTKSFDFEHAIVSDDRGLAATIASTVVAFDYESERTIAIPAPWRERIAAFEAAGVY
jgi:acyl-CoA thioester hydrolase